MLNKKDDIFDPKEWVRLPRSVFKDLFNCTPLIDEEVLYSPSNPDANDSFYFNAEHLVDIERIPFANQQQIDEAFAR